LDLKLNITIFCKTDCSHHHFFRFGISYNLPKQIPNCRVLKVLFCWWIMRVQIHHTIMCNVPGMALKGRNRCRVSILAFDHWVKTNAPKSIPFRWMNWSHDEIYQQYAFKVSFGQSKPDNTSDF
jgi:hypothetical protein